ncbi:MAG: hypothetical protein M3367_03380, partial [Acidobacteriota bacterium]|nr:hypothetical protein [Acidobacteriota bacterium]
MQINMQNFPEAIVKNEKIVFPKENFNINSGQKFIAQLRYYFSLFILAVFFLLAMPPIMLAAKIKRDPDYTYPWASWGAKAWMRWSGMKIKVRGRENLAANQSYVFISNHRSYLDT